MNCLYLSEQDFSIQQGKKGNILCNKLPGISLVLFHSKKCNHCSSLYPVFHALPQYVPACQFAMLNITDNMNVAYMSQKTIDPLTAVPYIVLYVNGTPFMKYNGAKTVRDIVQFVNEVLSRIQSKRNFTNIKIDHGDAAIPEYAAGIPYNIVCEGDQCYLTVSEINKTKQQRR